MCGAQGNKLELLQNYLDSFLFAALLEISGYSMYFPLLSPLRSPFSGWFHFAANRCIFTVFGVTKSHSVWWQFMVILSHQFAQLHWVGKSNNCLLHWGGELSPPFWICARVCRELHAGAVMPLHEAGIGSCYCLVHRQLWSELWTHPRAVLLTNLLEKVFWSLDLPGGSSVCLLLHLVPSAQTGLPPIPLRLCFWKWNNLLSTSISGAGFLNWHSLWNAKVIRAVPRGQYSEIMHLEKAELEFLLLTFPTIAATSTLQNVLFLYLAFSLFVSRQFLNNWDL